MKERGGSWNRRNIADRSARVARRASARRDRGTRDTDSPAGARVTSFSFPSVDQKWSRRPLPTALRCARDPRLRGGNDVVAPPTKPVAPQDRRTLSVSVNSGPFIDAGVALPPAVFPWVMMTWQDDTVTLVACEKFAEKITNK